MEGENVPPGNRDRSELTFCGVSWEVWAGLLFWPLVLITVLAAKTPNPLFKITLDFLNSL